MSLNTVEPTMNVVELKTFGKETNEATVALLRELLSWAEAGEIIAIAIAALEPSGASRTQSTASGHFQELLGAISILQHRMIAEAEH